MVEAVMPFTDSHGADVVYNTVASACFTDATLLMAHGAPQIFISDSAQQQVAFNIFNFYRNQHSFAGINTQELDVIPGLIRDEVFIPKNAYKIWQFIFTP